MWAFFFSCSFCVLPMNAKGVFIVCVYRKLYWLLILNITHHRVLLHLLYTIATHTTHHLPYGECFSFGCVSCWDNTSVQTLVTTTTYKRCAFSVFCSICFTPSPHITFIFRFWAFLLVYPYDYTCWMQKSLRSQFCACERYSYTVCCFLYSKLSMKIKPPRWFTVLDAVMNRYPILKVKTTTVIYRFTSSQPYFVSERFYVSALVFPCVTSKRRSERIWEPVRAIPCVALHHLRTPSPRVPRKTPVKVHRIITQKTITF